MRDETDGGCWLINVRAKFIVGGIVIIVVSIAWSAYAFIRFVTTWYVSPALSYTHVLLECSTERVAYCITPVVSRPDQRDRSCWQRRWCSRRCG
jgi:hypothetical protein